MWKTFFEVADFLCNFIPSRRARRRIRTKYLFDWRKKYRALKAAFPRLKFRHVRMIKGGWNIGFVIDKKYVFKIRKFFDDEGSDEKILQQKRITDAMRNFSPFKIPKIKIIQTGEYTFYRYNFIRGKNLNNFSLQTIEKYREKWGRQIAGFIFSVHNSRPTEIDDLRIGKGDGWNHNDICNNMLVNKKTMDIVGLIDWEYAGWGMLETEFRNCIVFSKNMKKSGIDATIRHEYKLMNKKLK